MMKGIITLAPYLEAYLESYCIFRDFVLNELYFEFETDVKPVVYAFAVGVFVFKPEITEKEDGYVVRIVPQLLSDSPDDNDLLHFFENFVEAVVRKELYVATMNFTQADLIREHIIRKMIKISKLLTSGEL